MQKNSNKIRNTASLKHQFDPAEASAPQEVSERTVSERTVSEHGASGDRFSRRGLFKLLAVSLVSSLATAGYARQIEPQWMEISRVDILIPNLPAHLQGRRLAQLSDIHLSHFIPPEQLSAAVDTINQIGPDWVVLTGDFVSRNAGDSVGLIDPLRKLDMPGFAVWGNHDRWTSLDTIRSHLAETPVQPLQNQGLHLDTNLWLAGLDNLWGGSPDLNAALSGRNDDDITVTLVHEPDYFDTVLRQEAPVNLQISGHTHGGQVRLPRLAADESGHRSWAPVLPRYGVRYPIGLRRVNGHYVYTNRGLGLWPVRFRFNCRPELTIFTLQPA